MLPDRPLRPITDQFADPIDDDDLDTWVARSIYDHTEAERAGAEPAQTMDHPLHGWRPDGPDQAEWAMARLAEITAELAKIRHEHAAWADRVEQSRRNATRSLEHRARFFTEALRGFALTWQAEQPNVRKTLHLASGVVKCTTPQKPTVHLVPAGQADLVEWLQQQDEKRVADAKALKFTDPEPLISGVRKLVEARKVGDEWKVIDPTTGEVLPGLRAEPPGPTTAEPKPHIP